ncbi:MAG: hypothetical protein ACKVHO_07100 [Verrucomicrobiia bacterium]
MHHTPFRQPAGPEDISFLTIKDQKAQIERDEFDLASLSASQLVDVSRAAGRTKLEEGLLEILIIQFNTLRRFAINQGLISGPCDNRRGRL